MRKALAALACLMLPLLAASQRLVTGAERLMALDSLPAGRVAVVANQT